MTSRSREQKLVCVWWGCGGLQAARPKKAHAKDWDGECMENEQRENLCTWSAGGEREWQWWT